MRRDPSPTPSNDDIRPRRLVLELLEPALRRAGFEADDVDDSFNVIDRGILDSIEFLDLITQLEQRAGIELDLFDADPDVLTTVGGLTSMLEDARADH